MLLLIDNYDSFTYNLYAYFRQLGMACQVVKNDALTLAEIEALRPTAIVISPGPGEPTTAGLSLAIIDHFAGKVPLLGICLGHQAIGHYFGAHIVRAAQPVHGKLALIQHDDRTVFHHLPNPLQVVRYHSLVVADTHLPDCLEVSARTADGVIMALRHKTLAIEGVQFHPEAILTTDGLALLGQFLRYYGLLHT